MVDLLRFVFLEDGNENDNSLALLVLVGVVAFVAGVFMTRNSYANRQSLPSPIICSSLSTFSKRSFSVKPVMCR